MSPETYWKRRVFVLAGLLLVVALIAYGCNQFTGDEEQSASGDPDSAQDSSPSASVPPSSTPTDDPSPDDGDTDGGDGEESGSDNEDSGDGGEGGGAGSSDGGGDAVPAPEKPGDRCRPQDVVVTAKTDKEDYAWDEKPEITITVVNTADQTCTVDLGTKSMEVRVTSGDDRVFSSADCAKKGERSDKRELSRGIPETTTVTWDRKRSWKDCRDRDVNASSGTYVASLHGDYTGGAEEQVFRLN
ncbi:hypothetical protein F4561_000095 [Lipingzhangella halophila]|uniref:Uncharacterized protein n=1 Tax=Lipingzhangella halophila TaxID=1783352 RepID=A0A7W7RC39_9ACTN|nr:hypothetical protein [Lipingzhangella halophila]MBB4929275.1 hypothetical protein [Lipingzhangella halophila]